MDNNLNLVPEISYICGLVPSISLRIQYPMNNNINILTQVGGGYLLFSGKTAILSLGIEFNIFRNINMQSEIRILIIESNAETKNLNIENYNIIKNKPIVISFGMSF